MLKLFPGTLRVLQAIHTEKYLHRARLAVASSAYTNHLIIDSSTTAATAAEIARAAMDILEVVPGRSSLCVVVPIIIRILHSLW